MTKFAYARAFALAALALATPAPALAYVGPGAGLTAIGSLLALIATVFLMIVGFVWYPVRRLLRRRRKAKAAEKSAENAAGEPDKPAAGE